jgi:uncharacterized membrane protein
MFQLMLYLHIVGAIIAFGFGFAVPVIGKMAAAEPQHANWFLRAGKRTGDTILFPASISMAITGAGLIYFGAHTPREMWLSIAMLIYIVAILVVLFVQRPTMAKLIALTSTPPGPTGPDPLVPVLLKRSRMVGLGLSLAVLVIVFLMVYKPTF